MAMNNHMEARRRQIFMERVCAARKRLELAQQEQENKEGTSNVYTSQSDPMQSKENGPSKTARPLHKHDNRVVVFEKVVHDPNFYYRSAVELGETPPLHVNQIYRVIYPAAYKKI